MVRGPPAHERRAERLCSHPVPAALRPTNTGLELRARLITGPSAVIRLCRAQPDVIRWEETMTWIDILKILAVIGTVIGTAYGTARFVLAERAKQTKLSDEIVKLRQRLEVISTTMREGMDKYQALQEISTSAQLAIGADLHSICVPVPHGAPTHLKIIISSDPKAEKVIGKEFPIDTGLAGRVFNTRNPEFVNNASQDPQHYNGVDSAAGTTTGEGGILSYPLISSTACLGVAQFMKNPGSAFTQEDISIIGRFANRIVTELLSLDRMSLNDPRYGNVPQVFASILFSDINDYSSIASKVDLYQTVNILDEYYRRVLNAALRHNAVFEEYLGDGVYLSFQGSSKTDTVISALNCACEMQKEYDRLMDEWKKYQLPVTEHNFHTIGIASGNVFEGTIGHPQYRKRKIIGRAVDLAAHLVEKAKENGASILIDSNTFNLVGNCGLDFVEQSGRPKTYLLGQIKD
jgi:class 3 adenylate cyclase